MGLVDSILGRDEPGQFQFKIVTDDGAEEYMATIEADSMEEAQRQAMYMQEKLNEGREGAQAVLAPKRRIEAQLPGLPGVPADQPGGTAEFDPYSELPGFGLRTWLGMSNKATEQRDKIARSVPGADARVISDPVSGRPMVVVRPPYADKWIPIDSPWSITMGDVGDIASYGTSAEIWLDILGTKGMGSLAAKLPWLKIPAAKYAKDAYEIAPRSIGNKAAAIWGRTRDAFRRMPTMAGRAGLQGAGAAGGGFAGAGIDSLLQEATGYEYDTPEEIFQYMQDTGMAGGLTEMGMYGLARVASFAAPTVRRLFFQSTEGVMRAIRAAREWKIPFLAADIHPAGRRAMMQQTITGTMAERFQLDRMETVYRRWGEAAESLGDINLMSRENLERYVKEMEDDLLKDIDAPVGQFQPGHASSTGIVHYQLMRKETLRREYEEVHRLAAASVNEWGQPNRPWFNVKSAQDKANQYLAGVPQDRLEKEGVEDLADPLGGELRKLMETLSRIDPNLAGHADYTALQQMQTIRTRAFNIMDNTDFPHSQRAIAADVHHELSEALYNPIGGSKAFRDQLAKANAMNKRYERITGDSFVRRAIMTEAPEEIGRYILDPTNVTAIRHTKRLLRGTGQEAKWERVVDGYRAKLLADPAGVHRIVKDPAAKRGHALFLDANEREAFEAWADATERHQRSLLVRHLKYERELGQRAIDLATDKDTVGLKLLVERMGGKDSPGGEALKQGLMMEVLNKASYFDKGRYMIRPGDVVDMLNDFEKSGHLQILFNAEDMRRMGDLQALLSFMYREVDAGAAMHGGGVASGWSPTKIITSPHKWAGAQSTVFSNYMSAQFFFSPFMQRVMNLPTGEAMNLLKNDASYVRMLASATAVALERNERNAKDVFRTEEIGSVQRRRHATRVNILNENLDPTGVLPGEEIDVTNDLAEMMGIDPSAIGRSAR